MVSTDPDSFMQLAVFGIAHHLGHSTAVPIHWLASRGSNTEHFSHHSQTRGITCPYPPNVNTLFFFLSMSAFCPWKEGISSIFLKRRRKSRLDYYLPFFRFNYMLIIYTAYSQIRSWQVQEVQTGNTQTHLSLS